MYFPGQCQNFSLAQKKQAEEGQPFSVQSCCLIWCNKGYVSYRKWGEPPGPVSGGEILNAFGNGLNKHNTLPGLALEISIGKRGGGILPTSTLRQLQQASSFWLPAIPIKISLNHLNRSLRHPRGDLSFRTNPRSQELNTSLFNSGLCSVFLCPLCFA